MLGKHLIKTWAKTQANVALSSAESEFYGTLKTAQESIGLISLARELGQELKARLLVDASAALGVAQRLGVGKLRHLQTGALWLQEQELRKVLSLEKVPGSENRADTMTKNVTREILERHIEGMGGVFASGRAKKAVQIHQLERCIRQRQWDLKTIKSVNEDSLNSIVVDDEFVDLILEDIEAFVIKKEMMKQNAIERGTKEWERRFCREEGRSLKLLKSQGQ